MRTFCWTLLLLLAMALPWLPTTALAADVPRIDPRLQQRLATLDPADEIPIIVRMHDPIAPQSLAVPTRQPGQQRRQARAAMIRALQARAEQSRQPLQAVLARHGVAPARQLWLINGMAFNATAELIEEIAGMLEVAAVEYDRTIEVPRVETAQVSGPAEGNINLVNAPELWAQGYAGQGATIAIVDTGVDVFHPDLGPRWRGGSNSWYDPNGEHPDLPIDLDGHGTGVAGVVLGGDNGGTFIGVAPEAQWIGVKIFNDSDEAFNSVIVAGLQWLLDPDENPDTDDAPDIVNNSWAGGLGEANQCNEFFRPVIQTLKAAGIAVVFAAGNSGPAADTSLSPGNYPESFAVGSVGTFESETLISEFSARGPSACDGTIFPEVVAPGNAPHRRDGGQTVTGIKTSDLSVNPDPYVYVAGTSFAAPHVSGVMALLLGAFPDAPVSAIETALIQSATDLGSLGADNSYGFGLVDAAAAFAYLDGQQQISVTDSILPETDHLVPFGGVSIGLQRNATVNVRNTGSLPLQLEAVDDSGLAAPFAKISDDCSDQLLASGASCSVAIRFAPLEAGGFAGSLAIVSNVVGQERVTVDVTGTGVANGTREILVTDSVLPSNDQLIAFGQIEPDQNELATISVDNIGSLSVQFGAVDDADISLPFSIESDTCSGTSLDPGVSCRIIVRFAPIAAGDFTGSLAILSDADGQGRVTIDLTGTTNTPPVAPRLLAPANGATVGSSVTFSWQPASDADGDAISQTLVYAQNADFTAATSVPVDDVEAALLGAGGLLLGFGLAAALRRRRRLPVLAALSGLLVLMAACGGGGGGGSAPPVETQSVEVSGLQSGATYYWKMVAVDSRGAETESGVRSFVVE